MRRAAKIDRNHQEVADAFTARGWFVRSTAALGDGFPDLLIAKRGVMRQIEVKDGAKVPSARTLNPDQVTYHQQMQAAGVPVIVIEYVEQVVTVDLSLMQPIPLRVSNVPPYPETS